MCERKKWIGGGGRGRGGGGGGGMREKEREKCFLTKTMKTFLSCRRQTTGSYHSASHVGKPPLWQLTHAAKPDHSMSWWPVKPATVPSSHSGQGACISCSAEQTLL